MYVFIRIVLILLFLVVDIYLIRIHSKRITNKINQFVLQKKFEDAIIILDKEIRNHNNSINYYYLKMCVYYVMGHIDLMLELINHVKKYKLRMYQYKDPILNLEIKALYLVNDVDKANILLDEYLEYKIKKNLPKPVMVLILKKFHDGDYEQCKSELEKLLPKLNMVAEQIICDLYLARIFKIEQNFESMNKHIANARNNAIGTLYYKKIDEEFIAEDSNND